MDGIPVLQVEEASRAAAEDARLVGLLDAEALARVQPPQPSRELVGNFRLHRGRPLPETVVTPAAFRPDVPPSMWKPRPVKAIVVAAAAGARQNGDLPEGAMPWCCG